VTDLVDPHGRTVRDLRISVTDRCNFRCSYCMPAEGMEWLPRSDLLTFEEMERIARVFVERFSIDGIRLTGGEPTVRAHLPLLVSKLAALDVDLSMTTNGATFRLLAEDLRAAGLGRVNVSLDSLRPERFLAITRRDELGRVLDGIAAAKEAGFDPVKVNVVLERGMNDDEIVDFATWGREQRVAVRFIEFMPLDASGAWVRDKVVSQDEILDAISAVYPLVPAPARGAAPADRWLYADGHWVNTQVVGQDEIVAAINDVYPVEQMPARGAAPADRFRYLDGGGTVGVIPTVTKPFCGDCDRVRLTAEGDFRTCLFATSEVTLLEVLR